MDKKRPPGAGDCENGLPAGSATPDATSPVEPGTLFGLLEAFVPARVSEWHPEKTVDIDIRIDAGGVWHYRGSPIRRHRISRLFATVLMREGAEFYLVTPAVRYRICVDDAPFLAVELNRQGQGSNQTLYFRTNMDEVVLAGGDHPIMVDTDRETGEPAPYIEVRDGLNAKMTRSVFYQMAEWVTPMERSGKGRVNYGLHSAGTLFIVGQDQTGVCP